MNSIRIKRARRNGTVTRTMSEIMIELYTTHRGVTRDELVREGFTEAEVDTLGQDAKLRAERVFVRQIAA